MKLYLKKMVDNDSGESFYKVGVTKNENTNKRFSYGKMKVEDSDLEFKEKIEKLIKGEKYIADHPYDIESLHEVKFKYEGEAFGAEDKLLKALGKYLYKPNKHFSGYSECFKASDDEIDLIKQYMTKASEEAKKREPNEIHYKLASIGVEDDLNPVVKHEKILEKIEKMLRGP